MTRVANQTWYIGSTVVSSGKTTELTHANERLRVQPWAYNTLECYGCHGCETYPTDPCKFTKLQVSIIVEEPSFIMMTSVITSIF